MNYAGVTIDFYDDFGATVKAKFPTVDQLPEIIKTADVRPHDSLPNEAFALVALDNGQVIRKLACHDPGTTAMSVMYLMEHGDKLPQDAVKTAAWNLVARCQEFGLKPPAVLTKLAVKADNKDKTLSKTGAVLKGVVDTTGKAAAPIIKTARPSDDADYAVIQNGKRLYPIDTIERVKLAEDYWLRGNRQMDPAVRRQFAVKLASKAQSIGVRVDDAIKQAGATTRAKDGDVKVALELRKLACQNDSQACQLLDDLFEKRASIEPEVFAGVLNRFDAMTGLSGKWDQEIPDPWASTYGLHKTADELVWEDGPDRMTRGQLEHLVWNRMELLTKEFTPLMAEELRKDPTGVFNSLPTPHRRILARLAADSVSDGDTEMDSEAPAPGKHKSASKKAAKKASKKSLRNLLDEI